MHISITDNVICIKSKQLSRNGVEMRSNSGTFRVSIPQELLVWTAIRSLLITNNISGSVSHSNLKPVTLLTKISLTFFSRKFLHSMPANQTAYGAVN